MSRVCVGGQASRQETVYSRCAASRCVARQTDDMIGMRVVKKYCYSHGFGDWLLSLCIDGVASSFGVAASEFSDEGSGRAGSSLLCVSGTVGGDGAVPPWTTRQHVHSSSSSRSSSGGSEKRRAYHGKGGFAVTGRRIVGIVRRERRNAHSWRIAGRICNARRNGRRRRDDDKHVHVGGRIHPYLQHMQRRTRLRSDAGVPPAMRAWTMTMMTRRAAPVFVD